MTIDLDKEILNLERTLIERALAETKGNKTQAAKVLNISFRSLRYRLEKHGLDKPEDRMNWCQPHWNQLRETINAKGLGKFVAQSGAEAVEALVDGRKFEPLLGCWARINAYMLESPAVNGRVLECPLCILVFDGQPQLVRTWLEGCTDEALQYAVANKLVETQ